MPILTTVLDEFCIGEYENNVCILGTNTEKGICAFYSAMTKQPNFFLSPFDENDVTNYMDTHNWKYYLIIYDSELYEEGAELFEKFEKVYQCEEGFILRYSAKENL